MGDQNFQYFTLDEDSEIDEYVADDPNFKRKVFWYDLLEQTIRSSSRLHLIVEGLVSLFGFLLQIKLIYLLSYHDDWKYLSWTISGILLSGGLNLISFYNRKKFLGSDSLENVQNTKVTPRARNLQGGGMPSGKTSKFRKAVQLLRQFSFFLLISPVMNIFYYWHKAVKNEHELKRPLIMRSQPQPTKHEISSVKSIWCNSVKRAYMTFLETILRFIPFGLLQVFILVCYKRESVQPEIQSIQIYAVTWQVLYLAWTCTRYANAHFNYTKTMQFQDLKESDIGMLYVKVTRLNTIFYYVHNMFSILFRLYCIAVMLDYMHYWTALFLFAVFSSFHGLVSIMSSRARFRYENPPSGLAKKSTDLISRWVNILCSHNIKQECFVHFTCIFFMLFAIPRYCFLYLNWSTARAMEPILEQQFNDDDSGSKEDYEFDLSPLNMTRFRLASECSLDVIEGLSLRLPLLTGLVKYMVQLISIFTYSCSPHLAHIQNDLAVTVLLVIHCTLSFIYLAKLKNRIHFENEFPAQESYKFWTKWLTKDWVMNDTYEIKKIILSLVASDDELDELRKIILYYRTDGKINCSWKCLGQSMVCCCPNGGRRFLGVNTMSKLHILINTLWEKYVEKTPGLNANDDGSGKLFQILERRRTIRNLNTGSRHGKIIENCCDTQLNALLEFLLENFVLEDDVVRMLILFIEKFDDYITNTSNSYRLANIDKILNTSTD